MVAVLYLVCIPVTAVVVDVTEGTLPPSLAEGEYVTYVFEITDIPAQANSLELSTDLYSTPDVALWDVQTDQVTVTGSVDEKEIILTPDGSFPKSISVNMTGFSPKRTTETSVGGITIITTGSKDGYVYYQVTARDVNEKTLGNPARKTFSLINADEVEFMQRANAVSDVQLRVIAIDLYEKGLRADAYKILEYAETPTDTGVSPVLVVVGLIIGLAAGFIIGKKIEHDNAEKQKIYET